VTSPPTTITTIAVFQRLCRPYRKLHERFMPLLQLARRLPCCQRTEFLPSTGQSSAGAAARAAMPPRAITGQTSATRRCALVRASSPTAPLPPTSTPTSKLQSPTSSSVFSSRPGTSRDNLKFPRGLTAQTVTQVNSALWTCL